MKDIVLPYTIKTEIAGEEKEITIPISIRVWKFLEQAKMLMRQFGK